MGHPLSKEPNGKSSPDPPGGRPKYRGLAASRQRDGPQNPWSTPRPPAPGANRRRDPPPPNRTAQSRPDPPGQHAPKQRRRPQAKHPLHPLIEALPQPCRNGILLNLMSLDPTEGHLPGRLAAGTRPEPPFAAEGPLPFPGDVDLIEMSVADHSQHRFVPMQQGNAHGAKGQADGEMVRLVQGIDHPQPVSRFPRPARFLPPDRVIGK